MRATDRSSEDGSWTERCHQPLIHCAGKPTYERVDTDGVSVKMKGCEGSVAETGFRE